MNTFVVSIKLNEVDNALLASLVEEEDAILGAMMQEGILTEAYVLEDMSGAYLIMNGDNISNIETQLIRLPLYQYMNILINQVVKPPKL